MRTALKASLVATLLIVLAAVLIYEIGDTDKNSATAVSTDNQQSPVLITATQLWSDFYDNEVDASKKYDTANLFVGGIVLEVRDSIGSIKLHLKSYGEAVVRAGLQSSEQGKAATIKRGNTVMVQCKGCRKVFGQLYLRDCVIKNIWGD